MSIGQKIKELRDLKGLSQDELSDKIGVSKSMISLYENDTNKPSNKKLLKFADFFGVSIDYFKEEVNSTKLTETGVIEENKRLMEELNEVRKELAAAQKEYIELLKKINK